MSNLKPCRECTTSVSISAKSCPNCGARQPAKSKHEYKRKRRVFLKTLAVLWLIGFLLHIFDGENENKPYRESKAKWKKTKLSDGTVMEGYTVNGEPFGHWTITYPDGRIDKGKIVNGQQHGYWTETYPDGMVRKGQMVNGKAHGEITIIYPTGATDKFQYVNGKRQ